MTPGRILVIEKDPALAAKWTKALQERGYRTTVASQFTQGLAQSGRQVFDVLIAEWDGESFDLLDELHRTKPSLSVIVLSDKQGCSVAIEATKHDAHGFLLKPF